MLPFFYISHDRIDFLTTGRETTHTHTLTDMQTFAVDLVGPACVVAQGFDAAVQVNEEGLQKGLPSVQSLQGLKK